MPDFSELAPVIPQDPRRGDAIHQKILKQYETIINDHQETSKGANKKKRFFMQNSSISLTAPYQSLARNGHGLGTTSRAAGGHT